MALIKAGAAFVAASIVGSLVGGWFGMFGAAVLEAAISGSLSPQVIASMLWGSVSATGMILLFGVPLGLLGMAFVGMPAHLILRACRRTAPSDYLATGLLVGIALALMVSGLGKPRMGGERAATDWLAFALAAGAPSAALAFRLLLSAGSEVSSRRSSSGPLVGRRT